MRALHVRLPEPAGNVVPLGNAVLTASWVFSLTDDSQGALGTVEMSIGFTEYARWAKVSILTSLPVALMLGALDRKLVSGWILSVT